MAPVPFSIKVLVAPLAAATEMGEAAFNFTIDELDPILKETEAKLLVLFAKVVDNNPPMVRVTALSSEQEVLISLEPLVLNAELMVKLFDTVNCAILIDTPRVAGDVLPDGDAVLIVNEAALIAPGPIIVIASLPFVFPVMVNEPVTVSLLLLLTISVEEEDALAGSFVVSELQVKTPSTTIKAPFNIVTSSPEPTPWEAKAIAVFADAALAANVKEVLL